MNCLRRRSCGDCQRLIPTCSRLTGHPRQYETVRAATGRVTSPDVRVDTSEQTGVLHLLYVGVHSMPIRSQGCLTCPDKKSQRVLRSCVESVLRSLNLLQRRGALWVEVCCYEADRSHWRRPALPRGLVPPLGRWMSCYVAGGGGRQPQPPALNQVLHEDADGLVEAC